MTSTAPKFSIYNLFEAAAHMGHKTMSLNPLMKDYIYGTYNTIHVIDLQKTFFMLQNALNFLQESSSKGSRVLFVSTRCFASSLIKEEAIRCGQYYVNEKWSGGLLTNWKFTKQSVTRLLSMEETINSEEKSAHMTKKEKSSLAKKCLKLNKSLSGIKDMNNKPDILVTFSERSEKTPLLEAKKLGIKTVSIIDTNSDPRGIDYVIPGNDDSTRAIGLYAKLIADAIILGMKTSAEKQVKDKSSKIADIEIKNK